MNRLILLLSLLLAHQLAAAPPRLGPKYVTDSGTVGFLRRHLVTGADIQYPRESDSLRQQGSAFVVMHLRDDGTVESLTVRQSTGFPKLDQHVKRALETYRFKRKTKGPLVWLVSFLQPTTVIVKVYREGPEATRRPTVQFGRRP